MFEDTKTLTMHINNPNPNVITCVKCEIEFQKISDRDEHLLDEFREKKHKCEQCYMTFVMEWQLENM